MIQFKNLKFFRLDELKEHLMHNKMRNAYLWVNISSLV